MLIRPDAVGSLNCQARVQLTLPQLSSVRLGFYCLRWVRGFRDWIWVRGLGPGPDGVLSVQV